VESTARSLPSILLLEDDELLADILRKVLSDAGEIVWASSAEDALALLSDRDWDLIIADIELPGMDGLEFLQIARTRNPEVASLVVSGRTRFDYAVEAIRAGADDYVTKPVDPANLLEKVQAIIAARRARRPQRAETVLAVGAHPDDVEIGCGGILLRHSALGHSVSILTLTGGEAGGEPGVRARESQAAAELISARLFMLDLTDTSVTEHGATISAISRVVEEVGPTTIYTHSAHDVHQDHRNAHNATLVAARQISRVYAYQSPSSSVEFQPSRFVTIDDFLPGKLAAIRAYGSQVEIRGYLDEELLAATARYWSRFSSCRYAEPLEVLRESEIGAEPSLAHSPSSVGDARDQVPT
jgi:LmbE family N-acetylglucosaminyl deacetylase/CheY-like chemotaxis protein